MNNLFTPEKLTQYLEKLRLEGHSVRDIKNKVNTLHAFISWCYAESRITSEVYNSLIGVLITLKVKRMSLLQLFSAKLTGWNKAKTNNQKYTVSTDPNRQPFTYYVGFALLLILMALLGAGLYNQLFKPKLTSLAYPNTLVRGTRILSFQGRLTDTLSNPIVTTTDVTFKLYTAASGGTLLYTGACTGVSGVVPDEDGIFNTLIGSDCGMTEIPATVFSENPNVFLGITVGADSEMTPRQQIANVGYALNSETLQGLPPGKNISMIPYINDQGDVLIAASAPGLRSTYASATFNISSANAVTLASAGSGDITLNATQSGTLKFQTGGTDRITVVNNGNVGIGTTNPSAFNLQVAGHVGPNITDTYDLGSISQEWRNIYGQAIYANGVAVCDANGTNCPTTIAGWTDAGAEVYLTTTTDRVGIGVTNPVAKLHVEGAVTGKALGIFNETGDQSLLTASASGVTKFLVDHVGNVGIGVTNPGAKLDVKSGGTNSDVFKIVASDGSRLGRFVETSGGHGWFEVDDATGNPQALFRADGGASYIASGNFGIGTSTPLEVLDVRGNASVSGNIVLAGASRAIQSTAFNALTLGGSTTGSILLNPNNGATGGLVAPTNTNVTDLGNSAQQFRNIYGQNLFVNGVAVCDANGNNCPASSGSWTLSSPNLYPAQSLYHVGIGTTTTASMISQLYVTRTLSDGALGKALAIFNQTESTDILTASASGVPRMTVLNDGTLQFHQASSITTTTGNLTLNSTGGTTTVSDNLVVTGTSDLQGAVSDSTGNLVLDDTVDIGSSVTGVNVTTTGLLSDIDGNLILDDTVDIGSSTNGLRVDTTGVINDINGNIVLNDTVDIGSSVTGVNISTTGLLSDIDGNLILNDTVDIGSSTNGLRVDTTGVINDINGNIVLNDTVDIGSSVTGVNISTTGLLSDIDGNLILNDTVDIGSSTNGLRIDTTGVIIDINGNIVLNDTVDIGSSVTGVNITTTGVFSDIDGNLVLNDAVDIGSSVTGLNISVGGIVSDIDGNLVLNDIVDLGSSSTGLNVTTGGLLSDIDGNLVLNDTVDIGSTVTGLNITTAGVISDIDGSVTFNDTLLPNIDATYDLGSTAASWRDLYLTGQICFDDIDCISGTSGLSGGWTDDGTVVRLTTATDFVGIGTTAPTGKLQVEGAVTGKALAIFNETGDQAILTASASGVSRLTVLNDGTLQFHQASSITTTTGNLTLNSAGGTTTVSDNLVVTGTSDLQGAVSDSTGNLVLDDTTDIGSSVTGVNVTTTGLLSDIDGNLILDDTVDIGSSTNGLRVDTTGVINDINGNIVLNDTVDIGSSVTGVNVSTTGLLSDIDGNLVLNDTVDIGSTVTGINITTGGTISDIDGNIVLNDATDIGSSVTGVNVTTTGLLSDIDGNLILDDTVDIGSSTNGLRVDTTGVVSDINGNIVLNDAVDIGSSVTGVNVTTAGVLSDIDGSLTVDDHLLPNIDATYDLGNTAASWRNLYLTGQICFDDTDCFSTAPTNTSGWTDDGTVVRLTTATDFVGIGTTAPTGKLQVEGAVTGKALAIFNETGDQAILTASASGVSRLTVLNDGTLQFHQASSITTTTGNLTLNSTGGTTNVNDNLVVTGTSDLQGAVSDSTGNLVLDDTVDIGSSVTGVNITTTGLLSDIDGNLILDDTVDIGSSTNGLRVDTTGVINDINGNIVLNDTVDIGSSVTGVNITTTGLLSDIDGNLILDDTVDIGSSTNGLRVDTTGVINDINGNIVLNDTVDIGSSVTGVNVTTTGLLSDIDGNLILNDTVDIGSSTNGIRIDTTGVISDINGNIVLNDTVDIGSSVTGVNVTTTGLLSDIDGNLILNDTVDIGSSTNGLRVDTTGVINDINGNIVLNDTVDIGSSVTGVNVSTAGVLSDIDGSLTVDDHLLPNIDATYDLGSTAASWRDLYLTGQICFDDTDCLTSASGLSGGWTDDGPVVRLTTGTDFVGIGTTAPTGKLQVEGAVTGKALAIFNETGDQAILTASASGVSRLTVLNDGTLQFHQASSITTTTGNLTLNSAGGTTTVSDNLVVTGTSDLQGAVSNSTGNLVLDDTTDIGSSVNGVRIDTAGLISDINGNLVLNDVVDIGSTATGLNVTVAGVVTDIDGNIVLDDTTDIGSAANGIRVDTDGSIVDLNGNLVLNDVTDIGSSVTGVNITAGGLLSDIDGNLILNDTVDIGSTTNGLRIDTGGVIIDINGNIVLNDAVDIGSSVTGINVSTTGLLSDIDGNLILNDTVDIGSSTNGLRIDTTGVVSDINGNIVLNDAVDIGSSVTGVNVTTGGVLSDIDGNLILNDTVDIGSTVTGLNITTAGVISDIDGSVTFADALLPSADATHDIGSTAASWKDLYLTGQLCFDDTDCTSSFANGFIQLQGSTPGSQQVGNMNISGAVLAGYFADTSNTAYGLDPAGTSNFGGYSLKVTGGTILALDSGTVGIGTGAPVGKLHVEAAVVGKALAMFNELGDQALLTASASGVSRLTVLNDGTLQFHQASSITTTTGNLTLNSTGGTTTVSDNLAVTGTSDLQGAVSDSNSNLVLDDTVDVGSSVTGINVSTTGLLSDIDGNLILNDTVDIGSSTNGLRVDTTGVINDINGNIVLNDAVDVGSSVTGVNVTTTGLLSDIDGNLILNDTVDIGSSTNGLRIDTTGVINDINGNIVLNDAVDIGSSVTGINVTTGGVISDIDGSVTFNDTLLPNTDAAFDLGSTAASWRDIYLTGQICFDDVDCFSSTSGLSGGWTDDGAVVRLSTATDLVGIGTASAVSKLHLEGKVTGKALAIFNETGDQDIFTASASGTTRFTIKNNGNVGIGTTNPAAKLEIGGSTSTITNTTGDITITSTGNLILNGASGGNVGIGTTIASDAKLRVISTYSGATAGELYGEYVGTSFGIADTGLKQGLRVATSATHTSGTQAQLAGLLSLVSKTGTSTVTSAYGLYSRVDNTNATGNIVNAYGLYIDDSTETGTITNDFGLYQVDSGAKNYFAGNVGIGTTNAGYPLHLSGSTGLVNLQIDNTLTGSTNTASTFLNRGDQANGYALHYFGTAGSEKWQIGLRGGNDNFYMRYLDSLDRFVIDTNGNIGMGTNTPNAPMHLSYAATGATDIVEVAEFQRSSTGTANDGIGQRIGFYLEDTSSNIDEAARIEIEYDDASSGTEDSSIKFFTRDSGTLGEAMRIDLNGNLGINTAGAENERLDVEGNIETDASVTTYTQRLCHNGANQATNNLKLGDCNSAGQADLAEMYAFEGAAEPGDIVVPSSQGDYKMKKSGTSYEANMSGIVSTNPTVDGIIGWNVTDPSRQPVALAGRIPLKVSLENGPIHTGDPLTSSSIPGVAMKATQSGNIIGHALEDYDGNVRVSSKVLFEEDQRNKLHTDDLAPYNSNPNQWPSNVGKIMAMLNKTWYNASQTSLALGTVNLTIDNNNQPIDAEQPIDLANISLTNQNYTVANNGSAITLASAYAKVTSAKIVSGLLTTENAIVNNLITAKQLMAEAITATVLNVQDMSSITLKAIDSTLTRLTVSEKLTSPVIETDSLTTSTIKPKDNTVVIDLSGDASASATPTPENSGKLASLLIKGLNNKTVASIDAAGNASLSGSLAAKSATISGELAAGSIVSDSVTAKDASVSGTVKAKEVIADNINALSDGLSSTQHSVASQSSTLQSLSGDVNNIQQLLNDLKNQPLPDPSYYQNLNQPVPASNSGQLQSNAGETILEKLTVTGYTLLSDAYVANSFAAGDVQIQGNSVLALASELKLSALDNINLFDGAVMIAKDGTITTRGEVIAQGGVRTNEIKSINAGDDIKVTLSNNSGAEQTANTVLASAQPKLKIQDGTGTEVASIDASGSAKFKDLALDQYLEATSSSVVVSAQDNFNTNGLYAPAITTNGKTIGVGTLPTNSNVIAIYNEKVTSKSLIYVTPTTPTDNKTLYIAEKVGCENAQGAPCKPHFTVAISGTVPHDIQFNWWIIN